MSVWRPRTNPPPLVVGHRGGRGDGWPQENSMAAFERARGEGARAVETDARLSSDGYVVLCHDPMHQGLRVARSTREALEERGLARLEELLAWAREQDVALNVELKRDLPTPLRLSRKVARLLRDAGAGRTVDVIVSSFDPALVGAMAALLPTVPRAWLMHPRHRSLSMPLAAAAYPPLVQALHPERTQSEARAFTRWKSRGLAVGVYTVNDVAEGRRIAAMGADWLFTDSPGAMLAALG